MAPDSLAPRSKTRPLGLNLRPSLIPILHKALHIPYGQLPHANTGLKPYFVDYDNVCPKCSNQCRVQNQSIKLSDYG
jgi:hypothetical protein